MYRGKFTTYGPRCILGVAISYFTTHDSKYLIIKKLNIYRKKMHIPHTSICNCTVHMIRLCKLWDGVRSLLTSGRIWWSKLERVAQHIIVVPDIKLVVSRIIVHRGNILIRIGKSNGDTFLSSMIGIIGKRHQVTRCFTVIVLVDWSHCIKHSASHEGVGRQPLVKAGLPGAFKAQRVRVHLWAKRKYSNG